MNATLDELEALTVEYQQRVAGRPLTSDERRDLGRLLGRLDKVRHRLALALATSPAEGVRIAHAGEAPLSTRAN